MIKKINVAIFSINHDLDNVLFKALKNEALLNITKNTTYEEIKREKDYPFESIDVVLAEFYGQNEKDEILCSEIFRYFGEVNIVGIFPVGSYVPLKNKLFFTGLEWDLDSSTKLNTDKYARLIYQIKNARINSMISRFGLHGKWTGCRNCPQKNVEWTNDNGEYDLVVMGASAGGTEAITAILSALPENFLPIVIVQHMPRDFVSLFASHLQEKCAMSVCLATGGEEITKGNIYITQLDKHIELTKRNSKYYIELTDGEKYSGHRPSINRLFLSAAKLCGKGAIGVLLTGMGQDGARGLLKMRNEGAFTIGQDEQSCAIYGMPEVAYRIGAVTAQLPLNKISDELINKISSKK